MGDVISFAGPAPAEDQAVLVCECRCISFVARRDGRLVCCNCATEASDGGFWIEPLVAETPEAPFDWTDTTKEVTTLNAGPRQVMAKIAAMDPGDIAILAVADRRGRITTWSVNATGEDRPHLENAVDTIRGMVLE